MAYSLPLLTFNILFSTKPAERKIRGVCEIQDWKDSENKRYGEEAGFGGTLFRLDLEERDSDQLQWDTGYRRQLYI